MDQEIINIVTFAIAVLGSILGIINTVYSIDTNRVKIRVRPIMGYPIGNTHLKEMYAGIEVTNQSPFPVSIRDVGFLICGIDKRAAIITPLTAKGAVILPFKLEAREQETFYVDFDYLVRDPGLLRCSYCVTACGTRVLGKSRVIKQINEEKIKIFASQAAIN